MASDFQKYKVGDLLRFVVPEGDNFARNNDSVQELDGSTVEVTKVLQFNGMYYYAIAEYQGVNFSDVWFESLDEENSELELVDEDEFFHLLENNSTTG